VKKKGRLSIYTKDMHVSTKKDLEISFALYGLRLGEGQPLKDDAKLKGLAFDFPFPFPFPRAVDFLFDRDVDAPAASRGSTEASTISFALFLTIVELDFNFILIISITGHVSS
jgi:hypothetical protein